jgi:hypothetical protein
MNCNGSQRSDFLSTGSGSFTTGASVTCGVSVAAGAVVADSVGVMGALVGGAGGAEHAANINEMAQTNVIA